MEVLGNVSWVDSETKPEIGKSVIVFMVNKDVLGYDDETGKAFCLSETAVGKWLGDHWEIDPPYHKYPISSMMDHEKLTEGVEITRWSEGGDEEIEGWKHRLDLFNEYDKLELIIDPDKEETLYRALSLGAALIESIGPQYPESKDMDTLREYYMALKDLQFSIDMKVSDVDAMEKE